MPLIRLVNFLKYLLKMNFNLAHTAKHICNSYRLYENPKLHSFAILQPNINIL